MPLYSISTRAALCFLASSCSISAFSSSSSSIVSMNTLCMYGSSVSYSVSPSSQSSSSVRCPL